MPTRVVSLPGLASVLPSVRLAYLHRTDEEGAEPDRSLLHLRTTRWTRPGPAAPGMLVEDPWRRGYLRNLPLYAELLASSLPEPDFDCLVSPPSRFLHALPYRKAFRRRRPDALDLSAGFEKRQEVYAGCGHPLADLCRAMVFRPPNRLQNVRSVLIVDDILWRGTTAAAVVHHLRTSGLPPSAKIQLACPLWIN